MNVSSLSSTSPAGTPTSAGPKRKTSLSQEDFLNLFITQLKNQNPLEPLDNYQMASQMAQFNSLDSLNRIQQTLQTLGAYQASMNGLQATGLIGKQAEVEGHFLTIKGGKVSDSYYQLSRPGRVKILIYDERGQLIRTLEEGIKDITKQKVVWDGKSQTGIQQPDGKYLFQVAALDEKGEPVPARLSSVDVITGIHFENGIIYLNVGSEKVTLQDVRAILSQTSL